jgi:hypothetical protein
MLHKVGDYLQFNVKGLTWLVIIVLKELIEKQ